MRTIPEEVSTDTIIDLRDVIARYEFVEDEGDGEAENLLALLDELKGYGGDEQWRGDWYPVILIRNDYMREYAEETAEDCGLIQKDATWPNNCIDWDEATDLFKEDYSQVEFEGNIYWYR